MHCGKKEKKRKEKGGGEKKKEGRKEGEGWRRRGWRASAELRTSFAGLERTDGVSTSFKASNGKWRSCFPMKSDRGWFFSNIFNIIY